MFAEIILHHPMIMAAILLCNLHLKQSSAVELRKTELSC